MAVISVNATGAEHLARNYIEPTKPVNTAAMSDKRKIDPHVRAKLEELGADVVRSKLIAIMEVRDLRSIMSPYRSMTASRQRAGIQGAQVCRDGSDPAGPRQRRPRHALRQQIHPPKGTLCAAGKDGQPGTDLPSSQP
jgi:hypothetical protein